MGRKATRVMSTVNAADLENAAPHFFVAAPASALYKIVRVYTTGSGTGAGPVPVPVPDRSRCRCRCRAGTGPGPGPVPVPVPVPVPRYRGKPFARAQ